MKGYLFQRQMQTLLKGVTGMESRQKRLKFSLLISALMALLTFGVFYLGVGILLGTPLLPTNFLAMAVLGLIIGSIAFLFAFFRLKFALGFFVAGFAIGSAFMLYTFWDGVAGWEDLIGLLSFLFLQGLGLGVGLLLELIVFLVKKSKESLKPTLSLAEDQAQENEGK
ncbi:MAG: hypothetical protein GX849_03505 [Clostridiaceae bacterium]|nr:hypothetical protein [Clostridiaceae bacterium]